jgi:cellulose synthase/poly-beta-1,6-N-acetylglucosamine synthase-like glycosyltransferase
MNPIPSVSIIIPAKNAARTIAKCLQAVLAQKSFAEPYEVIVVDDGSDDTTAAIANGYGVRVIHLEEGIGPAAARNAGAAVAKGEILVFTDADCEPESNWLVEMVKPFEDPAVVGVRGAYRSHQSGWVPRFVQQEYAFKYMLIAGLDSIDFIDTYSAAYRRSTFMENGGFEKAFPVPCVEDQEFSFRLARKGYRMVFAPDAIVFHLHDRNVGEYVQRKFGIGYWKAFMLRWMPERLFQDTHTPTTQRAQIGLLALILLAILASLFWPGLWYIVLMLYGVFYFTALPFFVHLAFQDGILIFIAPFLILLRAGALGFGLLWGFLFPRKTLKIEALTSQSDC